jgi:hypothetical protein
METSRNMTEVAHTQTPDEGMVYPGYVNFTALDDGRVKITVRAAQLKGPGEKSVAREGELAQLVISGQDFAQLIADANALQVRMPDPDQPTMDLPFAGDAWPGGKAEGAKTVFVDADNDDAFREREIDVTLTADGKMKTTVEDLPEGTRTEPEAMVPHEVEGATHGSDAIVVDTSKK